MTAQDRPGPIWSAEYRIGIPAARSPIEVLRAAERAAAERPWEPDGWGTALVQLLEGAVRDDDLGAGANVAGVHPLKVGVVTAYHREGVDVLHRCHASVVAQTYPCRHIMVADGYPRAEIDGWNVEHVGLEHAHADYGDTPRAAGGERALALGCDGIAYLDADNTFRSHHVESLVARCLATGAAVIHSGRTLHFPDGRNLGTLSPDDSRTHIDTNCLFLAGGALSTVSAWLAYPRALSMIGDRLIVRMLKARGFAFACTGALTVRYTVNFASLYRERNLPVPPDARAELDLTPVAEFYRSLDADERERLDAVVGYPVGPYLRVFLKNHGIDLE